MAETIPRLSPTNNKVHPTEEKPPGMAWTPSPKKPTNLTVLSFLVTILFNHIFGFFAYHFTVSAKHSWQLHDYSRSKRHSKYAVLFITLGIILGLATYALAFSLYFTLKVDNSCTTTPSSGNSSRMVDNQEITTTQNSSTVTTDCCRHCSLTNGPNEANTGLRAVDPIDDGPSCSVYCTTTGDGPIYPDPNGKYTDCCFKLNCILN